MLPDHCRHVSIRKVDFKLDYPTIREQLMDSRIYKGTDFLILNNGAEYSIVRVGKTPRRGLFWLVTSVEMVSEPKDTVFESHSDVDVLNKNSMVVESQKHPGKTVVVKGKFEHVSFIIPEPVVELTVLEVIPPEPPKAIELTRELLKFRSFSKPILLNPVIVDIYRIIKADKQKTYLLPCHASETIEHENVEYLDEFPELKLDKEKKITLVGCDLSLRIFKDVYDFEPEFINICPAKLAEDLPKDKPILIKCCSAKKFEQKGNLYFVPWGATYDDINKALNAIIKNF
jgi:hypothetical protein